MTVSSQKSSYVTAKCFLYCRLLTVSTIQKPDGAKNIAVGFPIAIVAEEGDDFSGVEQLAQEASQEKTEKPKTEEKDAVPVPPKPEPKPEEKPAAPKEDSPKKTELSPGDRIFATPIAKKIALERGIPLSKVKGSGPNGRILREDVEKYKTPAEAAGTGVGAGAGVTATVPLSTDYVDIPVSNIRRVIGSRLTQSKQDIPHYYLTVSIDMSKVLKLREVFNKTLAEKDKGAKLSVNDFIIKAVSCALNDVPEANSAWLGEVIRQ